MFKFTFMLRVFALLLFFQSMESAAQYIIREGGEEGEIRSHTIILPYVFSSETLGFGVGLGGTYGPKSHPHSLYYGTAYVTDNGSALAMVGGHNLPVPGTDRLHLRPDFIFGHFTHMRVYVDGNPDYPTERAGSNESSKGNYIEENAREAIVDLDMRYTLPWGHYRNAPVHTYITRNGILIENPSGAESWNPLESGQSTLQFKPYYRKQFTDVDEMETLYFQLGYEHDNRDFKPNPHRGYLAKAAIAHDPDWLQESRRWTSLQGEIDGYIPLWDASWSRQQTLALSWWSAYSPSYDPKSATENDGKPPYFTGPTLGGYWRLRGYPANRFHDKAAIHYSAEYRVMPEWQPFGDIDVLDPLKIRWWQVVGLVEVGRVAPSWDFKELHTDMKYDVGIGLRGMFHTGIGRLDLVVSEEGFSFVAMFGQTF